MFSLYFVMTLAFLRNLRIKPAERDLIECTEKAKGKNRTDFVLEAARSAADEALIDQRFIIADSCAYQEFLAPFGAGSYTECRAA